MNRRYTPEEYLEKCDLLRQYYEHPAITTDIIVGFPGETEEDFEETMDVVRKVRYDSAFTFIYSKRTGTPAASMEEQVPEDVIKARFDRLLKEVQKISAEKAGALTGQTLPVLIEEQNEQDASLVTGRLSNNSVVHLPGTADMIGKILDVKLTECRGFYYLGERVHDQYFCEFAWVFCYNSGRCLSCNTYSDRRSCTCQEYCHCRTKKCIYHSHIIPNTHIYFSSLISTYFVSA